MSWRAYGVLFTVMKSPEEIKDQIKILLDLLEEKDWAEFVRELELMKKSEECHGAHRGYGE